MEPASSQDPDLHLEVTVPVSVEDAFRMWTDSAEAREFLVTFEALGENETRIRIRHYGIGSDANWEA